MEDGVLISPAPYAAPAAYYFPLMPNVEGVEVFKGPSAVRYGPNSIGGALNLITRRVPFESNSGIDLALGQFNQNNFTGHSAFASPSGGILFQVTRLASDGFKELDGGGKTGFLKRDVMIKARYEIGGAGAHEVAIKLGYGDEESQETYLGLTEEDFDQNPYRRYAASQNDQMEWTHTKFQLTHTWDLADSATIVSDAYYHALDRLWSKLSAFGNDSIQLRDVVNAPVGVRKPYYDLLIGQRDSSDPLGNDQLVIGHNDRQYLSRGIQTMAIIEPDAPVPMELQVGVRYHKDQINRNHSEDRFEMRGGSLEAVSDEPTMETTQNKDSAEALAWFLQGTMGLGDVNVSAGIRHETISLKRVDRALGTTQDGGQNILVPGLGAYYQLSPAVGLLAGVYKGYTPIGPGQDDRIEPEESVNYEFGARGYTGKTSYELIGFYSDYQNIKGVCTFSSGCQGSEIDREHNGGEAEISGIEWSVNHRFSFDGLTVPVGVQYTYTKAAFTEEAASDNAEWGVGLVRADDPLPYVPEHQGSLKFGVQAKKFSWSALLAHTGKRFDQAVQEGRVELPAHTVVDMALNYYLEEAQEVYLKVDNLLDERYVVSLRPYGARPGKPRSFLVGLKWGLIH